MTFGRVGHGKGGSTSVVLASASRLAQLILTTGGPMVISFGGSSSVVVSGSGVGLGVGLGEGFGVDFGVGVGVG